MFKSLIAVVGASEPSTPSLAAGIAYAGQGQPVRRLVLEPGPDASAGLGEWISSDTVCLAHDAAFCGEFLEECGVAVGKERILDTWLLSHVCFPCLPDHTLPALCARLGLPVEWADAAEEAEALLALWRKMRSAALDMPPALLVELAGLHAAGAPSALCSFWLEVEREVFDGVPSREVRMVDVFPAGKGFTSRREPVDDDERCTVDAEALAGLPMPDGPFADSVPGYEYREGQVSMVRKVAEAFNSGQHLLVEAGTGIGKSMAYLLPAVHWARANDMPVIVSTNTKNLQSQLIDKDLPLIDRVLGMDFKAALLKGRMNYLCIRKLLHVLLNAEFEIEDDDERRLLATVLGWLSRTASGDFAENAAWGWRGSGALGVKLTATGEECMGRSCRHYRRCFLWRARARAQAADVVVANHSLVFAEMNVNSPSLPPYAHIIFDEAHNIEDAATRHFSVEVSQSRVRFILNRLWKRGRRKRRGGRGLIPAVIKQAESGAFGGGEALTQRIVDTCEALKGAVEAVEPVLEPFIDALDALMPASSGRDAHRLRPGAVTGETWQRIAEAREQLLAALAEVRGGIEKLIEIFRSMEDDGLPFHLETVRDLDAMAAWVREVGNDIVFVLSVSESDYVYWVERVGRRYGRCRAWAAPVCVGRRLADELYAAKESIVFSSATLSVGGSYGFLKKRLGLDLVDDGAVCEFNAGTPFDYARRCLAMVPMFLPEPQDQDGDYATALGELLTAVFRRTDGRALSLFTSYAMLKRTSEVLREGLGGIRVLVQGESGSREHITEVFREDVQSVLMGTHSFWEGVDVVGESLSCLVLARLPFGVFTDPIIEARCERVEAEGGSAFFGYSLPSAVIRFRQGFGRLIRHRQDRGVVIVADRRIVTKRYGGWFRRSIPARTVSYSDREEFLSAVEEFLGEGPSAPGRK